MKSIYLKLFLSYFFLMLVSILPALYQLYTYNNSLLVYSDVMDNLLLVEDVPELTNNLVNIYGQLYTDIDNEQFNQEYQELSLRLDNTFDTLDNSISSRESRVIFQGLYNSSNGIAREIETGLAYARNGDIEQSSAVYDEVVRADNFLADNSARLLLREIGVLQQFQQSMSNRITYLLISSLIFLLSSVLIGILLAFYFSRTIINPVSYLSKVSSDVSKGNFKVSVPKSLLTRKDEIGILSRSLEEMLTKITSQIKSLEVSQKKAVEQNESLEKMNGLMVNRELKMVELKKEIAILKEEKKPKKKKKE